MCVRSREQRKREKRTANSEFAKSISEASRQMREFILWIIESCLVVALGTIQPVRVREREREPHFVHCIWIDMAVEMKQNVSDWKWHGMQCSASISLTRVVWNAITLSPSLALNAKCVENRARRFSHASLLYILDFYYLAMQSINDFKCKLCEIWKHSHTHTHQILFKHLKTLKWKRHRTKRFVHVPG